MSFQVDTALVNAYRSNIEIQFQQKGSRLRPYVRVESQKAEFEFYDRIGPTDAIEVSSRHADTPLISTPHDRRRVSLRDFDWADMVDRADKIRMLADPTSSYSQNAVYAFGRKMDDIIVESAFGTAYSGKTGSTAVVWPAGQEIAANYVESGAPAASNLTIGKLRRARYMLDANEALEDGEDLVAVVHASQIQALLRQTEVTSADYNNVKALVEGKIDTFMGFRFVRMNRLPKSGNNRSCLFFARGGLLAAIGYDIMVDVGPRRDKRNSIQVYVCMNMGATRMWEEKVIKVLCDETV
jgi:Phage capsid protein